MGTLPKEIVRVLRSLEEVFSERVWDWVQVLVLGAMKSGPTSGSRPSGNGQTSLSGALPLPCSASSRW